MKYLVHFAVLWMSVNTMAQDTEFTITGEYQGKSLYVQNPLSPDKVNFCSSEIYLNEKLVLSSPKTSAYVIDLSALAIGDPVFVKIVHRDGCIPKIINPQVIRSKSKFQFLNIRADAQAISWTTIGEMPYGKYFVEHYTNKSWINISTISGKGSFESNQYNLKPDHHSGDNKYRIKYLQNDNKIFFSEVISYFSDNDPISFSPSLVIDKITLSKETDYMVMDSYGNKIASGKGAVIPLPNLQAGMYTLYIDNREEKFVKK